MDQQWWYCLKHGTVEPEDAACRSAERLGPYPTREAAAAALETAHRRTEEWDAEDRAWNERGERPAD